MSNNSILPEPVRNKYSREISFIRKCAKSGAIRISNHCYQQMAERHIKLSDVYDSIRNGTIMEVQNLERDTKIVFQDSNNKPPDFFVAVAIKPTMGICVTAYHPDPDKWILESNNQWRRKQHV